MHITTKTLPFLIKQFFSYITIFLTFGILFTTKVEKIEHTVLHSCQCNNLVEKKSEIKLSSNSSSEGTVVPISSVVLCSRCFGEFSSLFLLHKTSVFFVRFHFMQYIFTKKYAVLMQLELQ